VVVLKETRGGKPPRFGSLSNTAFRAWQADAKTIEDIAAWSRTTLTLTGAGDPERIRVTSSTASLFRVLGVRPIAGSLFRDADEDAHVVLLSESLWRHRFAGDPAAVGRSIELEGESYTIVGIVADAMGYPDRQTGAWIPFRVPLPQGNLLS